MNESAPKTIDYGALTPREAKEIMPAGVQLMPQEEHADAEVVQDTSDDIPAGMDAQLWQEHTAVEYTTKGNSYRSFIAEMALKYPLLSAEQEFELGTIVQAGIQAKNRIQVAKEQGSSIGPADTQIADEGDMARNKFVFSNIRLAASNVETYFKGHPLAKQHEKSDLLQAALIGLQRAVEKFDPHKGFKFSSYATPWVRQALHRSLKKSGGSAIRIPDHMHEPLKKLQKLEARAESDQEIMQELDLDKYKLANLRAMNLYVFGITSLEAPVGKNNEGTAFTLGTFIADSGATEPLTAIIRSEETSDRELPEGIKDVLAKVLSPRDRHILNKALEDIIPAPKSILDVNERSRLARIREILGRPSFRAELAKVSAEFREMNTGT